MIELNKEYTYQQICESLGWKMQAGNSKKAQIKELESCFEWYHPENKKTHKLKKSYIFTKMLRKPVEPSKSNCGGSHNNKNITPMIKLLKAILVDSDLDEYYSFSYWYSDKLDLIDSFTGNIIYKDMDEIEAFCADYGIRNAELFKDYISSAKSILKRIFLKALERMEKDNECIYNCGYKFIYELGKKRPGFISLNELNNKIKEMETDICNKMNDEYQLSKKMKGRQLLMIIYGNRDYKVEFDERKIDTLMNDKDSIDTINDIIEDTYGHACSGISDANPLVNYFPVVMINDIDFDKGNVSVLATEVTNIIRAKAKKEILNKHIKLKDKNGNVYDKIYKYTDLSDKNDIKKIEKLLFKYLDSNSSVEELNIDFDINADTSEIDEIMSNSYEDVWGDVIDLENDFSIDDILDMPIIGEFKSVPCKGCR